MGKSKGGKKAAAAAPPALLDERAVLLVKRLEQELLEHNDFFDMVVDMIPSKLYYSGSGKQQPQSGGAAADDFNNNSSSNPKYFKGPSEKEARKVAAKAAKRQKFDPAAPFPKAAPAGDRANGKTAGGSSTTLPSTAAQPAVEPSTPGRSRIEALRAKLHAKIASQPNRGPPPLAAAAGRDEAAAGTTSKRAARRLEKNRRREEARKRKKQAGGAAASQSRNSNATYTVAPATTPSLDPMQDLKHVDYGILSGLNADRSQTKNYLEANKALSSSGGTKKNLHKILADAEAKRRKLRALQNSTDAGDKERAAALQWSDTLREADGVRVKDDPARLRRAVKRRAAKKAKSQKAWKARLEQQSEQARQRQQIRRHNLEARRQGGAAGANLSKKKIVAVDPAENAAEAKKRVGGSGGRAGFEGRKQGFLNASPKDTAGGGKGGKKHKQQ